MLLLLLYNVITFLRYIVLSTGLLRDESRPDEWRQPMPQKRHRPAGAHPSERNVIGMHAAEARKPVSEPASGTSRFGRRGHHRKSSRKPRQVVLAVDLAVQIPDGRRSKRNQVRVAATATQSRTTPDAAFPGVRERENLAARVIRGVDPAGLARLLAAIAHGQRLIILFKLLACEATHQALARATGLKAGPLYYHLRELRAAGLIGPKVRDLYVLTPAGARLVLAAIAAGRLHGRAG